MSIRIDTFLNISVGISTANKMQSEKIIKTLFW